MISIATVITATPLTVRIHGDVEDTPVEEMADGTPALVAANRVYVVLISDSLHVLGKVVSA